MTVENISLQRQVYLGSGLRLNYFSEEIRLASQTVHMKCQVIFSLARQSVHMRCQVLFHLKNNEEKIVVCGNFASHFMS